MFFPSVQRAPKLRRSLEEFERLISDSSSVSSYQPQQVHWNDSTATLAITAESPRELYDDSYLGESGTSQLRETKSFDGLQAPRIANDRRRRNEARFGGGTAGVPREFPR